jgi:anti-anti-sigma factor
MRFDLNNPHLDIEPIYEDLVITFKDERIVTEDLLDRIGADILKLAEQAPPGKWIILDFKTVKFMSSAFLGFLVKLQTTVTQCRGHLKLRNLSPEIFKVFKITQLHKIFTIDTAS